MGRNDFTKVMRKKFRFRLFNAFFWIIMLNLAFFIAETIVPVVINMKTGMQLNLIHHYTAIIPHNIESLELWRFFSYMFSHGGFQHLLFNMLGLILFGYYVEERMGSYEFIMFYIVSGVFAGVFSYVFYGLILNKDYTVLIGASGSVYAVMAAFLVLFADMRISFFGLVRSNVAVIVGIYMIWGLISQLLSNAGSDGALVAVFTHIAGILISFGYCYVRFGINPFRAISRAVKNR